MSTIDEIMGQADDYARAWADAQSAEMGYRGTAYAYRAEEKATLREMIAAALADARREGATEAQQRMFPCCGGNDASPAEHAMDCPAPPTGERQAVLLTDEQIERGRKQIFSTENPFCPCDAKTMRKAARWAESAALAANGLTK